mgnify:CR=1 FL=1
MKINKEQFIKSMSQIQNLHSQQNTLNKLIDKLTDGFSVVNIGNYVVEELINMININLELKDTNLLDWWLYEDVFKIIYVDDKPVKVETLDELWDYIQNYN